MDRAAVASGADGACVANRAGAYQDLTADAVAKTGGKGCYWNQDMVALVESAGLTVSSKEERLGGLIIRIVATKA